MKPCKHTHTHIQSSQSTHCMAGSTLHDHTITRFPLRRTLHQHPSSHTRKPQCKHTHVPPRAPRSHSPPAAPAPLTLTHAHTAFQHDTDTPSCPVHSQWTENTPGCTCLALHLSAHQRSLKGTSMTIPSGHARFLPAAHQQPASQNGLQAAPPSTS